MGLACLVAMVAAHIGVSGMKTVRLLIQREIMLATAWALAGFVALMTFFDLLDELRRLGRPAVGNPDRVYGAWDIARELALGVPTHIYTLLPICLLIGGVFVMSRLAQNSEFTVLRTGGLGPWLAMRTLLTLGVAMGAATFVVGDYAVPAAERQQALLSAQFSGDISTGRTGAWLRESRENGGAAINVGALNAAGEPQALRIFEFNRQGRLIQEIRAQSAQLTEASEWLLKQVQVINYPTPGDASALSQTAAETMVWRTELTASMVSAELLRNRRMGTLDLYRYIEHLKANGQNAQRFQIDFWRKVFYPMSCMVMVILVLPFGYLHFRKGGIAGYVFLGVMTGISFYLLNNLFGFVGNLHGWIPWLAAASPSLIYSAISLVAFGWLVLRR